MEGFENGQGKKMVDDTDDGRVNGGCVVCMRRAEQRRGGTRRGDASLADEAQYEFIAKAAPTVTFDTFGSLDERLTKLGQLMGKQEEAAQWLNGYHKKEAAMWESIRAGPQDIVKFAGDIVIVPMPANSVSREATQQLLGSELWQRIPAVCERRAYVVDESKWNLGDAISRIRQLEHLPSILDRDQE